MYTVDQNIIPIPENSDQNVHLTHTHTYRTCGMSIWYKCMTKNYIKDINISWLQSENLEKEKKKKKRWVKASIKFSSVLLKKKRKKEK